MNYALFKRDLTMFSPEDIHLLAEYHEIPTTNITPDDLLWILAICNTHVMGKRTMPSIFSVDSQLSVEEYIENRGYNSAVNRLPINIKNSIKEYTDNSERKYDPIIYGNIKKALEKMQPIDTELILFRGQDDDELNPEWWISTSTDHKIAIDQFTNSPNCCLLILKVQPGLRILPVYEFNENENAWEQEVIIEGGGVLKPRGEGELGKLSTFTFNYSIDTTRDAT